MASGLGGVVMVEVSDQPLLVMEGVLGVVMVEHGRVMGMLVEKIAFF